MNTSEKVIAFLEANNCNVYNSCDSKYSDCNWSSDTGCTNPAHPCNLGRKGLKIYEELQDR